MNFGSIDMKLLLTTIFLISTLATAHSGRTDSSGGHNNRSTGGYHYHNSGYSTPSYSLPSYSTSTKSKQQQIDESIASYPGSCPCPYSRASNGSKCGKRSAWSKPGGYEPLCYESDIK
jgi:hypothetical protein